MNQTACIIRYALVDGRRSKPFWGGRGACPVCAGEVIAHHGDIEPHHWQHAPGTTCSDQWWEPETAWHKKWKDRFPEPWQEITIEDEATGKKHRADIKTDKGLVIELQNSHIPLSEIREREIFYGNMVWVINAIPFKDNFIPSSEVDRHLRMHDDGLPMKEIELKTALEKEQKDQAEKVREVARQLKDVSKDTAKVHRDIINTQHAIADIVGLTDRIIKWIVVGEGCIEVNGTDYEHHKRRHKERLLNIMESRRKTASAIQKTQAELNLWTKCEDDTMNGIPVKKIPFARIDNSNYSRIIVLDRASKGTFFPSVRRIRNENDLFGYRYSNNHVFYIDLSDIKHLQQTMKELRERERVHDIDLEQEIAAIKQQVLSDLSKAILSYQGEKESLYIESAKLTELFTNNKKCLEDMQSDQEDRFHEELANLQAGHKNQRYRIMNGYKGFYRVRWKHERKAWREASCHLFFDIGDGSLMRYYRDNLFQEISVQAFMAPYVGLEMEKE